jgi:hypothetical protein
MNDKFEIEFVEWLAELEREIEATKKSERITAEDLAIIVY